MYNKAIKPVAIAPSDTQLFLEFVFSYAKLSQIPKIITRRLWRCYVQGHYDEENVERT